MDEELTDRDYRVEVSGWDIAESFFVEKVSLELTQAGECLVYLKHPMREGLIVFLRLIESRIDFPALPIAYQVTEVSPAETGDANRVSLRKLRHRPSAGNETPASGGIELL